MGEQQEGQQRERLRPAPVGRFAGQSHVFDLGVMLSELRAEGHPAQNGHRQMTIFHRVPVAKVLFAFESGGELTNHSCSNIK